jgi:phosphoadenosine phosphosulfate reductase
MPVDPKRISALNAEYADRHPQEILTVALREHAPHLAVSFSGAEDVVLIDLARKIGGDFDVFTLETGRLHSETYQFIEKVRDHYGIQIEIHCPQAEGVQKLVRGKGFFSFYRDGHQECCGIRKVEPLVRALKRRRAWVTGQRKDQSPGTRANVPVIQVDSTFGAEAEPLVKFNPLANWTSQQVWAYIRENNVPYNPLHDRGFASIGCEPCTRPVNPGQHEREGRWWWEEQTLKECGLHGSNMQKAS